MKADIVFKCLYILTKTINKKMTSQLNVFCFLKHKLNDLTVL